MFQPDRPRRRKASWTTCCPVREPALKPDIQRQPANSATSTVGTSAMVAKIPPPAADAGAPPPICAARRRCAPCTRHHQPGQHDQVKAGPPAAPAAASRPRSPARKRPHHREYQRRQRRPQQHFSPSVAALRTLRRRSGRSQGRSQVPGQYRPATADLTICRCSAASQLPRATSRRPCGRLHQFAAPCHFDIQVGQFSCAAYCG